MYLMLDISRLRLGFENWEGVCFANLWGVVLGYKHGRSRRRGDDWRSRASWRIRRRRNEGDQRF